MNNYKVLFKKRYLQFGLSVILIISYQFSVRAQSAPAIQWNKTYGAFGEEYVGAIQQTSDGGFVVGGTSYSNISGDKSQNSKGGEDYWILRLDSSGNKIWDKTFGGTRADRLASVLQTSDGGFIIGGFSDSEISGDKTEGIRGINYAFDFWVIRIDSNGDKLWDKTYGGNDNDLLRVIRPTIDGGFILGGSSGGPISGEKSQNSKGSNDFWIVKIDGNGNKIWDKTVGGDQSDDLSCIQQTSDGGYILGGNSYSGISGDKSEAPRDVNFGSGDYWVVKLDSNGNKIWDKTFGGSGVDYLASLKQTFDGGYILGGTSDSKISGDKSQNSKGSEDFWVLKLDAAGNKIWDKTIGGDKSDRLSTILQTTDGGYVVGGHSMSGISGDKTNPSLWEDFWLVKLDTYGNRIWDKTMGASIGERINANCIQQTSDNGFILGGHSNSEASGDKTQPSQGSWDFWIVKLGPEVIGINDPGLKLNPEIFPNPSKGQFNFKLTNISDPLVEVSLINLMGREVWKQFIEVKNGEIFNILDLPTSKGMYLLKVKVGKQTTTRKVLVE